MNKSSKIYIAGHRGLVGSAILRYLQKNNFNNLVFKTSEELNLTVEADVTQFFTKEKPEYVFLAAAKVGGIYANTTYPADFIFQNLKIQTNIIDAAHKSNVKKLLFLGSSCIYPKLSPQPIKEEYLLSGPLEPTNDAYAIAKIAGIKMCQAYNKQYGTNFIAIMPTNLYGINDNFNLDTSHVLPALIRKFYETTREQKSPVSVWGDGSPRREFLFVDDLADACIYLMNNYNDSEIINVGTGEDISIKDLAIMVKDIIGYEGEIIFDKTKPNGTPRKLLDISKLNSLGWKHQTSLSDGIKRVFEWYKSKLG